MGNRNKKSELEAEFEETVNSSKRAEYGNVETPQYGAEPATTKSAKPGTGEEKPKGPKTNHYDQDKLLKYATAQIERRCLKKLATNADDGDTFILLGSKRCETKGDIKRVLREATIKKAA